MILYWKIKISKRPRWDTELTIKTWGRNFSKVSTWRDFEVYDENNEQIAIATTEWVLIDTKKNGLTRITDEVQNAYEEENKKVFDEKDNGKLEEPKKEEKVYEYTSTRRDMDVNHHVSNTYYLEFAYDALPEEVKAKFNNIEVYYKKQIKIGETISVFYTKEESTHIITIKSQDEKTLHSILKFY